MQTIRQQIIQLLSQSSMDIVTLAQTLGISEKDTKTHLPHIAKTVTGRGGELKIHPAQCDNCGYRFKDRKRITPPSRCPMCKRQRICGPWYEVVSPGPLHKPNVASHRDK